MEKFVRLKAAAVPLHEPNIDTDQLIPARFLGKPRRAGFADFLLRDRRFAEDGNEIPDFVLNKSAYRDARILLAGANFGCGSSRESAVYALSDYGFRVVIAPSFGDIFAGNCIKNGLLPVMLPDAQVAELCRQVTVTPGAPVTADLETLAVEAPDGSVFAFTMDPFKRQCLLEGLDEIGLTMRFADRIAAHEDRNDDVLQAG